MTRMYPKPIRHCERSEAIQGNARDPWIASSPFGLLAMTTQLHGAAGGSIGLGGNT
jgi:hypothetical protein